MPSMSQSNRSKNKFFIINTITSQNNYYLQQHCCANIKPRKPTCHRCPNRYLIQKQQFKLLLHYTNTPSTTRLLAHSHHKHYYVLQCINVLTQNVLSSTELSFALFCIKPIDKVCIVVIIGSFIPVKSRRKAIFKQGTPTEFEHTINKTMRGADKSLAQLTSRCHGTESIVLLEKGVCSCAKLQVFSCYRG